MRPHPQVASETSATTTHMRPWYANRPGRRRTLLVFIIARDMYGALDRVLAELRGHLVDRIAQPLAASARGFVEAELARCIARLEVGRRDPAQPHAHALAVLDRNLREQVDRRAREHAAVTGRRVEGRTPR